MSDNKKAKTQNKRKPQNKTLKRMSLNEKGEPVDLDEVVIHNPSLSELLDREKNMESRLSEIKAKIDQHKKAMEETGKKEETGKEEEKEKGKKQLVINNEPSSSTFSSLPELPPLPELSPPLSPPSEPEAIKEAKKPPLVIDNLTTSSSEPPVKKNA